MQSSRLVILPHFRVCKFGLIGRFKTHEVAINISQHFFHQPVLLQVCSQNKDLFAKNLESPFLVEV